MLSTGMLKKPWIWSACRSITITRLTPTVVSMSATTFAVIGTRAERGRRSCRAYPKYGIAAVTRAADARFSASTITRISIRLSLVGAHVDCSMNTSRPRTFSSSSTITSPSEKRPTTARPRLMFRCRHTASASLGFALPQKIRIRSKAIGRLKLRGNARARRPCASRRASGERQTGRLPRRQSARVLSGKMAGEEGFEPSNAGIKIRCLNQLGDSPAETRDAIRFRHGPIRRSRERCERMPRDRPYDASRHAGGQEPQCRTRFVFRRERREDAPARAGHPRGGRRPPQRLQRVAHRRKLRGRDGFEVVDSVTFGKDIY